MKIVKIPKKTKGQFREIAIPSPEEKSFYRKHLVTLNEKVKKFCSQYVHGFVQGKSPIDSILWKICWRKSIYFQYEMNPEK